MSAGGLATTMQHELPVSPHPEPSRPCAASQAAIRLRRGWIWRSSLRPEEAAAAAGRRM